MNVFASLKLLVVMSIELKMNRTPRIRQTTNLVPRRSLSCIYKRHEVVELSGDDVLSVSMETGGNVAD